jgi:hypothetical protein
VLLAPAIAGGVHGQEALEVEADVTRPARAPIFLGSAFADRPAVFVAGSVGEGEIAIDGRIDDPAWDRSGVAKGFVQREPVEGDPATRDTEVRILFSDEAMYVAARMWDEDPSDIARQLVRRDSRGNFDWFGLHIDPNLDRRSGYGFEVSAAGQQRDAYYFNDESEDEAWNAVWESEVSIDDEGWVVEMRIPLSQIRYESGATTWGLNLVRRRVENAETSYFALRSQRVRGRVSQFGQLDGVEIPTSVRRVEARPYALSSLANGPAEPGDPFFDGSAASIQVGGDVRFGLGSAFAIDATINPDFGQVDADPAVINLGAFEVFQEERRPYFVEDSNLLSFGLSGHRDKLFYSRRVGRDPQGRAPFDADYVDAPINATILGSAKLTGRTEGGLSVGGLFAMTDQEAAEVFYADDDVTDEAVVEPRSLYGVARLEQDLRGGDTQIGGIFTAVRRSNPADGTLDFLASSAYTGGFDFEHRWGDRTWSLDGWVAGSTVRGSNTAMLRLQRAANHRFQRPDAVRESVDSTATSLTGASWRLSFGRERGDHWTWSVWSGGVTAGFEVNDIGFSNATEQIDFGSRVNYRQITPQGPFRSYSLTASQFHDLSQEVFEPEVTFREALKSSTFRLDWRGEFANFWGFSGDFNYQPRHADYGGTRGGPVMANPGGTSLNARFNTDRRNPVVLDFNVRTASGADDSSSSLRLSTGIEFRPTPTLEMKITPTWSRSTEAAQYVTSTATLDFQPTFGRRYLFAELERESVSMETRIDVSLTPSLTFQLFAQPLLSSGDYVRYRQLEEARSFDFRDFEPGTASEVGNDVTCAGGDICLLDGTQYIDFDGDGVTDYDLSDRDFNVRSLIGNAVLRWEYRPGSTLFLVWQRQQRGSAAVGDFDFRRDLDALWGLESENMFMLKFDYWLPL